jgi:hypothetical protein
MSLCLAKAQEVARLDARLKEGMAIVNEAAQELTQMGLTVRLEGWGSPGMWGNVRCQGNSRAVVDDSAG